MHARAVDGRKRLDRARQLALERALVVDLLLKLRGAKLLRFHQFKADQTAFGQTLARQAQAHLVHLIGRHQQGAAAFGKFEGHVHLLQRCDDCATVPIGEIGVQHPVVGALAPKPSGHHQGGDGGQRHHQTQFLLRRNQSEQLACG